MTIDGTPFNVSAANLTADAKRLPRYSDRYTPLRMPIGTAIAAANPVRISVPTIALAIPPPGSPTGRGLLVKKSTLSDWTPWLTTKNSTNASGTSARPTHSAQANTKSAESTFRGVAVRAPVTLLLLSRPGPQVGPTAAAPWTRSTPATTC